MDSRTKIVSLAKDLLSWIVECISVFRWHGPMREEGLRNVIRLYRVLQKLVVRCVSAQKDQDSHLPHLHVNLPNSLLLCHTCLGVLSSHGFAGFYSEISKNEPLQDTNVQEELTNTGLPINGQERHHPILDKKSQEEKILHCLGERMRVDQKFENVYRFFEISYKLTELQQTRAFQAVREFDEMSLALTLAVSSMSDTAPASLFLSRSASVTCVVGRHESRGNRCTMPIDHEPRLAVLQVQFLYQVWHVCPRSFSFARYSEARA